VPHNDVIKYLIYCIEVSNNLTTYEYASLLASIEAKLEPKKFNCFSCITQYGNSKRLLDKSTRARTSKGCFDYTTKQYLLENIKYNTCIGNFVTNIDYLLDAFVQYEKGIMPFEGSLGNQPSKIISIFNIIEVRRNEKKGS
jgi:hypothetical protein